MAVGLAARAEYRAISFHKRWPWSTRRPVTPKLTPLAPASGLVVSAGWTSLNAGSTREARRLRPAAVVSSARTAGWNVALVALFQARPKSRVELPAQPRVVTRPGPDQVRFLPVIRSITVMAARFGRPGAAGA